MNTARFDTGRFDGNRFSAASSWRSPRILDHTIARYPAAVAPPEQHTSAEPPGC